MELSQEAYHLIVRYVGNRKDLLTLCTVSKPFQREAERALYDTLHLRGHQRTVSICRLLASTQRLSVLVDALSIFVVDDESDESDASEGEDPPVPDDYWDAVAAALRQTTKLRFLSIYFDQISDTSQAWVLNNCSFQLQTFHCDFEWDAALTAFLDTQSQLSDLYLADFRRGISNLTTSTNSPALPKLSILECTFTEAAVALVPGRPVVRIKTCFSRTDIAEKRAELRELHAKLKLSRKSLRALDLADESYTPEFTLELLTLTVDTFTSTNTLRYLGTLVLPVDAKQVCTCSLPSAPRSLLRCRSCCAFSSGFSFMPAL